MQFTAPYKERLVANREFGTIEKMDAAGNLQVRLDSGRTVVFNIKENPHLDDGYAVTVTAARDKPPDFLKELLRQTD